MKKLLKKISEINSKHWGMATCATPKEYKRLYTKYMAELESTIQQYVISFCDCKPEETTGCLSEYVCNNCGRTQRT